MAHREIAEIIDIGGDKTRVRVEESEVVVTVEDQNIGDLTGSGVAYGVYSLDQAIALRDALTEAIKELS